MRENTFGNSYDLSRSLQFFGRWSKLLITVFIVALALSIGISFLVKPYYQSTAVIFPTNSNRISKAIMDYHYSLDFMDYGSERDCEYAIQILSSHAMQDAVCQQFNLMEHYEISADDAHKLYKLDEAYRSNITIKRTEFLGVSISVLDTDPLYAADIANYIAEYYDTLCHQIHHARAVDANAIMNEVCNDVRNEMFDIEDSLRSHTHHEASLRELLSDKSKRLADLQVRASQTKVDMQQNVSYKFWLDHATPADKKAYPKRILIALVGSLSALLFCILVLLFVEWRRRNADQQ